MAIRSEGVWLMKFVQEKKMKKWSDAFHWYHQQLEFSWTQLKYILNERLSLMSSLQSFLRRKLQIKSDKRTRVKLSAVNVKAMKVFRLSLTRTNDDRAQNIKCGPKKTSIPSNQWVGWTILHFPPRATTLHVFISKSISMKTPLHPLRFSHAISNHPPLKHGRHWS